MNPDVYVHQFNAWYPVGTAVGVIRDSGNLYWSVTKSEAYMVSGDTAVIHLAGISGYYMLDRVMIAPPADPGVCRACGCTGSTACLHVDDSGPKFCLWSDTTQTLCSACAGKRLVRPVPVRPIP